MSEELTTTDSTAITKPETKVARTLADWEPVKRVITEEEEELFGSVNVSPIAPIYLRAYAEFGNNLAACARVGISRSTPSKWRARNQHFALILDELREEIKERWRALAEYRAGHGFEERTYDKDGNLVGRKVRQDPSFLRAMLAAQDPENWGSRGEREGNVTIIVTRTHE